MDSQTIHYEQPLNERIRTFLRLETLFTQTRHTLYGNAVWDSRTTLNSMIEILNIFERGDLRGEVIKELERHICNFQRLKQTPGVDENKLNIILNSLQVHVDKLQRMVGKFGQRLKDIELIATVRQRLSIPGGTCHFDIPAYHFWLQQPREKRVACLETWLHEFQPIEEAVEMLLRLTRESASPQKVCARSGFYQKPLEPNNPCQLIRVAVDADQSVFSEISGGKHRISIRFLDAKPEQEQRPTQTAKDVDFELSCCTI